MTIEFIPYEGEITDSGDGTEYATTYEPFIDTDTGAVGYKVSHPERQTRWIYFNPSNNDAPATSDEVCPANVFVYIDEGETPEYMATAHYYDIWDA